MKTAMRIMGLALTALCAGCLAPGTRKTAAAAPETRKTAAAATETGTVVSADRPPCSTSMEGIDAGSFQMGDASGDGWDAELPVHTVVVGAFCMDKTEVPWRLWQDVCNWGATQGYDLSDVGRGKAENHPVYSVNWYDSVKWCNARSQREGLTPCYRTRDGAVYQTGEQTDILCEWMADGYRLPTEAEWEKAARGGRACQRFPGGDTIQHSQANYVSSPDVRYDVSPTRECHPTYATDWPYTSPVGAFPANGYGLHDMSGNVWEWCWDRFGPYASDRVTDPRGASAPTGPGGYRVVRGGGWIHAARYARVAGRNFDWPDVRNGNIGFRTVRRWAYK